MTPSDALALGDLDQAISLQESLATEAVGLLHLAELIALNGDHERALDLIGQIDSEAASWPSAKRGFGQTLRAAIRRRNGTRTRLLLPEPMHLRHRWRAVRVADDQPALAARHVDRADQLTPEISGHVDGREFTGLRDADDRFASLLEVCLRGHYVWVAWEALASVRLAPARGTLDLAFRPATLTLHDRRAFQVTLPLIYPLTQGEDGVFRAGLETDFRGEVDGPTLGLGARLLQLGEEEVPLATIRQIDIRAPQAPRE